MRLAGRLHAAALALGGGLLLAPPVADAREDFPLPESLKPALAFWTRIYVETTTADGLIHDGRHLGVVYEVVRLKPHASPRAQKRQYQQRKAHWASVLRGLGRGHKPRSEAETAAVEALRRALGRVPTRADYDSAATRLRFQRGQRDRFEAGLVRAGAWEGRMRAVFRERGMPDDLVYLPHVESSFNPAAYSRYGAAGVWQFMRATGHLYLTISYEVDERLDPLKATEAAAALLFDNYRALGRQWPLAITAYNHGRAGLHRARRRLGTSDIGVIAERYHSRTFGFASRNFYVQFLAVREVVRSYESHFGPLVRDTPDEVTEVELPFYLDVTTLRDRLGVTPEMLRIHNPALRTPVLQASKRIPRGYVLRLPAETVGPDALRWLAAVPQEERHPEQHHARYYRVQHGDTLAEIAKRHGTTPGALAGLNGLRSRHRIATGQVLALPDAARRPPADEGPQLVRTAYAATAPVEAAVEKPPPPEVEIVRPAPTLSAEPPVLPLERRTTIVGSGETLGHFAEWLEVPTQRLRTLNRLPHGRALRTGQRLRLDFSRVSPETFTERRIEHHKAIEEDFFGSYRVTGAIEHKLKRGENPWVIAHRQYGVPIWLIERYNPETDFTRLAPGATIAIPLVESAAE